jgi:hypothetical protein
MPPTSRAKRIVMGNPLVSRAVFQFIRVRPRTSAATDRTLAFSSTTSLLETGTYGPG